MIVSAHDLIVVGAGPAGGNAALAAATAGLDVVLVDEQMSAGGQVWRKPLRKAASRTEKTVGSKKEAPGDALRSDLALSNVHCAFGQRVWSLAPGFRVDTLGPDGALAYTAPWLIVATGAHERIIPFAGWTLPGVMGLAAATILLKSEARIPGRRVVVAGRGPLLASVAAGIIAKGGEVVAVVDRSPRTTWAKALPALASQPLLLAEGAGWMLRLMGRRVPWLFGHRLRSALGSDAVEAVEVAPADGNAASRLLACDALVVGDGLVPGGEASRLLGLPMHFERQRGGWVTTSGIDFESALPGLYLVGDGAGIRGAKLSALAGEIAGLAVAAKAGRSIDRQRVARLRQDHAKGQRFSNAIADMLAANPADIAAIAHDTVVCRCEDVRRHEIDAAIDAGAHDINQLKHFTRCGMGPCQGRMCGDVAEELVALRSGLGREAVGHWTGRPPLRPVLLGDLIGTFDYADIPVPEPAPL